MGRRIARIGFTVFSLLFLMAAGVQFNDPAPALWVLLYGVGSILAGSTAFDRPPPFFAAAGFASLCAAISAYKGYRFATGDVTAMFEEPSGGEVGLVESKEGREMLGTLILAIVTAGVAWYRRATTESTTAPE